MENQIDIKLVSLSKFGTSLGQASNARPVDRTVGADRQPLLANGSTSDTEDDASSEKSRLSEMTSELDSLLNRLSSVNESLSSLAGGQSGTSSSVLHTLQRHQDILKVYRAIESIIKAFCDSP